MSSSQSFPSNQGVPYSLEQPGLLSTLLAALTILGVKQFAFGSVEGNWVGKATEFKIIHNLGTVPKFVYAVAENTGSTVFANIYPVGLTANGLTESTFRYECLVEVTGGVTKFKWVVII